MDTQPVDRAPAAPDPMQDAAPGVVAASSAVRPRRSRVNLPLTVLAVIAVVAALYLARAFFVPLLIGILASYALRPVVDGLQALRIPRAVGAALVLAALVGGVVVGRVSR